MSEIQGTVDTRERRAVPVERPIALVDLLDRVLSGGVVVTGDLSLCIADVELVRVSLRLLLSSVSALTAHASGFEYIEPETP